MLIWNLVLSAVFGAIIGSFLNVVIYRLPLGKSISKPRSHCPKCGHVLGPIELVPIFSFLIQRGKCKVCRTKISWRYPGVEALTAFLFALVVNQYGLTLQSGIYLIFTALLVALAIIDIDVKRLPDKLTGSIAILAVCQWVTGAMGVNPDALSAKGIIWGAAIGALPLIIVVFIGVLFKVEALGMGDVKLMLASGLLVGPIVAFYSLLIAFVLGGIGALAAVIFGKRGLKSHISFGPYLACGLFVALLYSTYFYTT